MTQAGSSLFGFWGVGSLVAFGSGRRVVGWQSARRHHRPQSFPANPHQFGTNAIIFLRCAKEPPVTTDEDEEERAHGRRRPPALFFSFPAPGTFLPRAAAVLDEEKAGAGAGRVR